MRRSGRTLRKIRETEFVVGRLTSRRINLTVPRMPLYAYRCTSCGASEEHLQKFSDAPVETCQACGGPLTRLISRTAFQLKGGGWYKDGYASSNAGGGSSSDSGSSGSETKSSSSDSSSAKAAAE